MRVKLNQKLVYWAPLPADQYGRPTFELPVELACQWTDKVQETITTDQDTVLSSASVIVLEVVKAKGFFLLTDLVDPTRSLSGLIIDVHTDVNRPTDAVLITFSVDVSTCNLGQTLFTINGSPGAYIDQPTPYTARYDNGPTTAGQPWAFDWLLDPIDSQSGFTGTPKEISDAREIVTVLRNVNLRADWLVTTALLR